MNIPLTVSYIVIPYLFGEWLRKGSGLAWLAINIIIPPPADLLASPVLVSYFTLNLMVASLLNTMDAAAGRKK